MRRALSDTIAFISFLLVITATVFWSRSYQFDHSHPGESLNFRRTDPLWWVISHRGTLTLCRQNGREWGQEFGKIEGFGFRFGGAQRAERVAVEPGGAVLVRCQRGGDAAGDLVAAAATRLAKTLASRPRAVSAVRV